jgi:broad specificity phosphatase PhoE
VQTAELAFDGSGVPVLHDWRLRECDYGELNGMPAAEMHAGRRDHLEVPYPGGESWRQAVTRGERFLADLPARWAGRRILVIGHVATRWALDHALRGVPVEDLMAEDFGWRPGWSYVLDT